MICHLLWPHSFSVYFSFHIYKNKHIMNYSTQGKFPLKAIVLSLAPDFCELRRTSNKHPGCLGWGLTKNKAKEWKDCFLHSSETGFKISTGKKGMEESHFLKWLKMQRKTMEVGSLVLKWYKASNACQNTSEPMPQNQWAHAPRLVSPSRKTTEPLPQHPLNQAPV